MLLTALPHRKACEKKFGSWSKKWITVVLSKAAVSAVNVGEMCSHFTDFEHSLLVFFVVVLFPQIMLDTVCK